MTAATHKVRGRVGLKDSQITSVLRRHYERGGEWDSAIIMEMDLDGHYGLAHVYTIHPCLDKK